MTRRTPDRSRGGPLLRKFAHSSTDAQRPIFFTLPPGVKKWEEAVATPPPVLRGPILDRRRSP